MLIEQKQTPHAIAFEVDLQQNHTGQDPEIKKRLEAESLAAQGPSITLDQIRDKLEKASMKRQTTL